MRIEHEFKLVIDSIEADFFFIACSGGVDSMVLLHLAKKADLPIHVLHVNYNLRGSDSLADADLVKQYCIENQLHISIHEVNLKEKLLKQGGNLQNEARKIRYDFFESKLNEHQNSCLLLAHHLDDQIETFWLQLYRGSGMKGMAGMNQKNGNLVRPLLNVSKTELISYASINNIPWREDKSNASLDYQRNLWRNEYLPSLRLEIPSISDSVLLIQRVFNQNLDQIYLNINEVLNEIKINNYITLSALENYNIGELIELFRSLSIPLNQLKQFLNLINSQKGTKIKWGNSVGIYNEIIREENGFSFIKVNLNLEIPILKIELVDQRPEKFDKQTYYFDPNRIIGDIRIRYWQRGDRMNPIGIKGSKLVSDIITDAKVPNAQRAHQLVICDDQKILACFGLCVDRRAIASDERQMLKVSLKNQSYP